MHAVWLPLVAHAGKRSAIDAAPSEGAPAVAQEGAKGALPYDPAGAHRG